VSDVLSEVGVPEQKRAIPAPKINTVVIPTGIAWRTRSRAWSWRTRGRGYP
jgi:hypothetical protein